MRVSEPPITGDDELDELARVVQFASDHVRRANGLSLYAAICDRKDDNSLPRTAKPLVYWLLRSVLGIDPDGTHWCDWDETVSEYREYA
jgi:hypothetical protein